MAGADSLQPIVCCLGKPVAGNPTQFMMEQAFAAAGMDWRYLTLEVPAEKLVDAITGIRALGFRGFNLTIPHKVAAVPLLDGLSQAAELMGAVNCIHRIDDKLMGENTDGKGFLRGVRQDAGMDPKGKRVVMLGAGGAARAIATELLLAGVADLLVLNRSVDRGEPMVAQLAQNTNGPIRFQHWVGTFVVPSDADMLVNATSIGLYPNVTAMPDVSLAAAKDDLLVCDAVFNPPVTPLLALAKDRGMPVLDGLSMLVYQGVIGFELWTGCAAPERVMKEALEKALAV